MRLQFAAFVIATGAVVGSASGREHKFDPTSVYKTDVIQGFTILINPEVLRYEKDAAGMKEELEAQLKAIARVLPAEPLAAMQKVRIWVEWEKKKDGAAEFHPSETWLRDHDYNPEKAGCVELSNARNFVNWSRSEQPWMVLHELSHAYHHLVLGERHDGIGSAYKQAVDRKLYESVEHIKGGKRKAYAMTNAKEYFAELSEAYFGKNDFFPFTRMELQKHDPVGFRLMEQTWGKPTDALRKGK